MTVKSNTLLWIGAGKANLSLVEFENYNSIVLVEAREDACIALEQQFISANNVQIVHALIDLIGRDVKFSRRSLGEFSTMAITADILDIFPSLTSISTEPTLSTAIFDLLESIEAAAELTLVLDILDINLQLLTRLSDNQRLVNVYEIIIPIPELSLFEGAATKSELLYFIEQQGFNAVAQDTSDPDIPYVKFKRNPLWTELNESSKKLHHAEVFITNLEEKVESYKQISTKAELNEQKLRLDIESQKSLSLVYEEQIEALKQIVARSEVDFKTHLQSLKLLNGNEHSADETQKQTPIEQMAVQVTALQNKKNELVDGHKTKDAQIAKLTAQFDQQAKGHQETKQQAESLKAQNEKLSADRAQKLKDDEQTAVQVTALQNKQNELVDGHKTKDAQIAKLTAQFDQQAKGHQETKQQAESLKAQNEKLSADRAQKLKDDEQTAVQVTALQNKQNELVDGHKNKDAQAAKLTAQFEQQAKDHQETKQQAESLKAQNEKLSADRAQKLKDNEQTAVQVNALQNKQNELVDGHKNKDAQIAQLTVQRDQHKQEHQEVKQKFNELVSQKVELENKLKTKNEQDDTAKKLNDLLAQVQNQNNVMKKNYDGIAKKLEYGFKNSVKQVESFIGVQSYLETGQLAMEYHGWPISSDVALFILGKVEKNNYDLIIEFGSGTSTQLFAKAINNQLKSQGKHIDEDLALIGSDKGGTFARPTIHRELPNRIVTFEHNKKYHNKTMAELEANKLSHLVDLVHAPLIEMKIENDDYLYYSCEHKLAQLATIFAERTVKILVLIDGPPGATGPLARLPAVPLLLNYLGKHQFDIVLDDYKRQEEIETVGRWKQQFEKRSLTYNEEVVQCEKGVFFCSLNF
jgi:hypothetical protein